MLRTLTLRKIGEVLAESAEMSAAILIIIALAGVFAWAGSTLGAFNAVASGILSVSSQEFVVLLMLNVALLGIGMLLDAISVFLILLPLLEPLMSAFRWDPVWFGVMLTMNLAIGQFTPPVAVNLMVTSRIAGIPMESTTRWVAWLVLSMAGSLALVVIFPELALWLPRRLGYV